MKATKNKKSRPLMPSIFYFNEGVKKYIFGRYETETIVNAIYKDLTEVQVGKHTVYIKSQHKTDEEWWCEVEVI